MRLIIALSCTIGLSVGGVALAEDASALNARLSGNTLTVTQHGPSGGLVGVSRVYLAPDGGYFSDNTVGQAMKGTWRANGGALCLTATDPLPPPQHRRENCLQVGELDRWSVRSPQGGALQYDIVAGRSTTPLKPVLPDVR
jgi:hypothetical protein